MNVILTGNYHITPFRRPVIDGGRIRFRVALEDYVLTEIGTFQLARDGQHRGNCGGERLNDE